MRHRLVGTDTERKGAGHAARGLTRTLDFLERAPDGTQVQLFAVEPVERDYPIPHQVNLVLDSELRTALRHAILRSLSKEEKEESEP